MDQIFQLQRQIQDLRQELNTISQVAGQLQRSEANHAAQLQRLSQNESAVTQQLQTIQQLCNRLNQDINMIGSMAQQISSQMYSMPFTSGQFGAGQFGGYGANITTGQYGPAPYGTFGSQFGGNRADEFYRNQQISAMAANRYGTGFAGNDYASNQYISSLANQGMLGSQRNLGPGTYGVGAFSTNLGQSGYASTSAGNYTVEPSHPVSYHTTPGQYGVSGFTGSQYTPAYGWSFGTSSGQMSSGFAGQSMSGMGVQNLGRYSNF